MSEKPAFHPFIEWRPCSHCGHVDHGILRLFEEPDKGFGPFNEDGMPAQKYIWTCYVAKEPPDAVMLKAAMTRPPVGALRALMDFGSKIARFVRWERAR